MPPKRTRVQKGGNMRKVAGKLIKKLIGGIWRWVQAEPVKGAGSKRKRVMRKGK